MVEKKEVKHLPIGLHYCIDVVDVKYKFLNSKIIIADLLDGICRLSNARQICMLIKEFKPQGLTGFLLLEESHISIHTYPEYGKAFIDIFTCGTEAKPENSIQYIQEMLSGKIEKIQIMERGNKNAVEQNPIYDSVDSNTRDL